MVPISRSAREPRLTSARCCHRGVAACCDPKHHEGLRRAPAPRARCAPTAGLPDNISVAPFGG
eukprot:2801622-Alexandrium_andersonii.AAC.1